MDPVARERHLAVIAMDSQASMSSEISSIFIAAVMKLLLFRHRVAFGKSSSRSRYND